MKIVMLLAVVALSLNAQASTWIDKKESTTDVTLMPFALSMGSTLITACTQGGCKEILAAQEDLSYFVASEGQVRTARAERALQDLRGIAGDVAASDIELAQAGLAALAQPQ